MTRCRTCQAEVYWARTERGNAIPLDPEPVLGGNIRLDGSDVAVVMSKEETAYARAQGSPMYQTHFVTCPNAPEHRKSSAS